MSAFHHEAVFYADREQYLAATLPEIHKALAADGAVLVAVADDQRAWLQEALGADADAVTFADMHELGRNPACIIPAWRDFLREAGPGPIVGIGEPVWPGRSEAELVECSRHESLLNLAFDGGRPWRLLCPYDTAQLAPEVLEDARRNHPHVDSERSTSYAGPGAALARDAALPAPAASPAELLFGRDDLSLVRDFVERHARLAGFDGERLEDLVLAANELADQLDAPRGRQRHAAHVVRRRHVLLRGARPWPHRRPARRPRAPGRSARRRSRPVDRQSPL